MKEIASSVRSLRMKHQMTQAKLAKRLGVQYQTVSKWENGISLPDIAMLPQIADCFGVTIDELFGRRRTGCSGSIANDNRDFLLKTYSQMYAPEAGPWNLSVENKYLMYRFADFFEKHFTVADGATICNIGIGAGEWDIYLSYKLKGGSLTSIDRLEICCRQLEQRLICEGNPNEVKVLCADAMSLNLNEQFEIVTVVGSTAMESGAALALLEQAIRFVKADGSLYYQSIDENEDCNAVLQTAFRNGMKLAAFLEDDSYGFRCHYYQFEKDDMQ